MKVALLIFAQACFVALLLWLLLSTEPPKAPPEPVPSPADVAALMDEARRITG